MKVIIAGGGPAGLTAGYMLCKKGYAPEILEMDAQLGGISKTIEYNGYRFDIGGHRFFSKSKEVEDFWHEIMPTDFLKRPRQSRIFYKRKFFDYPLKPFQAFLGLGPIASVQMMLSYIWIRIHPLPKEDNLEQWLTNRFGRILFNTFFKTYTEKVWGTPCSEIQAEWGAQRIKGLSLTSALMNAWKDLISGGQNKQEQIKTLIKEFEYPRLGPGQMWEICGKKIIKRNGFIHFQSRVSKIFHENTLITSFQSVHSKKNNQKTNTFTGDHFISTMPIRELITSFSPAPPQKIIRAANDLHYRDFITVALIINKKHIFTDNWIYIHDKDIIMGRIQNFKNWSKDLVADQEKTCLGLEYFAFEGDELWSKSDKELIDLGKKEVVKLGFATADQIHDGTVVRQKKAYPVYDKNYKNNLKMIRAYLARFTNLHLMGRNGLHKYNNQDHSMLTAMRVVENIEGAHHDIWKVNVEKDYHEQKKE